MLIGRLTFRVMYVKFIESEERTETDLADCAGGLLAKTHCPTVQFKFDFMDDVDLTTAGTAICEQ